MRKHISKNKDIRNYVLSLLQAKKAILCSGTKHDYLLFQNGQTLPIPSSPSCSRGFQNFKGDAQRLINEK